MKQPQPLLVSRKLIRSIRITRTGWAFILLTIALGGAALNTGNNLLYLMFGMLLSMLLINGFLSNSSLFMLLVKVRIPQRLYADRLNAIKVVLGNQKRRLPSYAVTLQPAPTTGNDTKGFFVFKLEAGKSTTLVAPQRFAERGRQRIEHFRLTTSYPFGLIEKHIPIPIRSECIVYPAIVDLHARSLSSTFLQGDFLSGKKGVGVNPYGVRDFQIGDDVRHIHWPSFAKLGRWAVKEFEMEKRPRITLDLFAPGERPTDPEKRRLRERTVSTAASLLMHLVSDNREVHLRINGRPVEPDGAGYIDHYLTHLALFDSEPTPSSVAARYPENAITILVSEAAKPPATQHHLFIGPDAMMAATEANSR